MGLAAWALIVSAVYLVVAMVNGGLAEALVVAFVALLLVPAGIVETREYVRDD
jgi:glycerol-3-phosphate responsive antiterminator